MYISVTLYCGYLIILWLFHLGISCTGFVLICTVVVLFCFVICVYVCVCVFVICILYSDWGFLILTEVSPCFFLSCKANARVKLAKTGHGPHSSTLFFVICVVVWLLIVLFYVLFVCICVLYYSHRVSTQLQLNTSYHIMYHNYITSYQNLSKKSKCITYEEVQLYLK